MINLKNKKKPQQIKGSNDKKSAQNIFKYKNIFKNGLCEVKKGNYSILIRFDDINYQISKKEEQISTFTKYCELLNYFDKDMKVQINIECKKNDTTSVRDNILAHSFENPQYKHLKDERNTILLDKALQGQNAVTRSKYLIVTFDAQSLEKAIITKNRIESDIQSHFKGIDSYATTESGLSRIQRLHEYFHKENPFLFDYENIGISGLKSKDYIAPNSFDFKPNKSFSFESSSKTRYGQVVYLKTLPSDINDKLVSDLSDLPFDVTISMHIEAVEQKDAFDIVQNQLAKMDIEKSNIEEKNLNRGRPVSSIPLKLRERIVQGQSLYDDLSNNNQRMFKMTFLVYTVADNIEILEEQVNQIIGVARKGNIIFEPLELRQKDALNSILPIGKNYIDIQRTLTTASTAIFIPFATQEMLQYSGGYYGLNALSRKLLMVDRRLLTNANGFFLGVPGSGKSFAAKVEIVETFLNYPNDQILIIDPEREYSPLVEAFGGEVIKISTSSKVHINPMDMSENYGGEESPIPLKSDFILSLFDLIIGGKSGLDEISKTIIDRAIIMTYGNPKISEPTLVDLYNEILSQPEPMAQNIALSLERYIKGSLKVFSNPTNVNTQNRFIVYDTKDLGTQIKPMAMLIVFDQIWNKLTENRNAGINTWIYIDEVHLLFNNEQSIDYCDALWKRARKWGGIPTGITQNVGSILGNDKTKDMLSNCEFLCLMNQSKSDREDLATLLSLSDVQLRFITNAQEGQGLIRAGKSIIPFINNFPKDTELYKLITTKFKEV